MRSRRKTNRLEIARRFLSEAKRELKEYEGSEDEAIKRLVCEKGWGSIAQALTRVAKVEITNHKDFGKIANELKQSRGIDVIDALITGERLHSAGFYHGKLSLEAIQKAIVIIEQALNYVDSIK